MFEVRVGFDSRTPSQQGLKYSGPDPCVPQGHPITMVRSCTAMLSMPGVARPGGCSVRVGCSGGGGGDYKAKLITLPN